MHMCTYSSQVIIEGSFHFFSKSLECQAGDRGQEGGGNSQPGCFTLQVGGFQPLLEFHLETSFLADKIKVFPLPNHYLIFEAITKLIVSISPVSSRSNLSLSAMRLQREGSAGPASGAREGRAGSRELSGCFQQGQAGGGHLRHSSEDGTTRRFLARRNTAPGALFSARAPHLHS